jgi:glycosyltransferase involved in cell wall biosynthesis
LNPARSRSTPRVTVVIPTYNRAHYLSDAIHSALNQTLDDLEVVVVDDGSTDATAELMSAIGDRRVRYLRQPHRGISAAMNAGMRLARGEYVARLDSDDLWLPGMLAALVGVLDAQAEFGVAYGKGQAMDSQGHALAHTQGMAGRFPGESLRSLVYDDCTCNVALVARRECFDRVGFYDEALAANEDWDMWLRVARYYRFCFIDKVFVRIRWHDRNFTGPSSPHFALVLNARTAPLDKLFSDPDLPPAVRAMKSAAYTNVYLFRGLRWLQKRGFKRAGREFAFALRTSEQPLTTGIRIAWFALAVPVLTQTASGRRAVGALAALRQRRRVPREGGLSAE